MADTNYTTANGQTFLDISMLAYGVADYAYPIAIYNNLSITERITPGTEIKLPEYPADLEVVKRFIERGITPITGGYYISGEEILYNGGNEIILSEGGIGNWQIEINFIIQ